MRTPLTAVLLMLVLAASGCSTKTGAIDSCSFEVEKLMLPWVRPDGTVASVISYDLRQSELLYSCIVSKGYVFDNVRANTEYAAGRSPGLVSQYKDPRNWSFGWFGLAKERPALVGLPEPAAAASAAPSQASSSR